MIIACDIDNTLNNFQEAVTLLFNERNDTNYTLDNFYDHNIENVLPVKKAIAMKEIYGEDGIYDYVKPIVGAQEALQKLIKDGHQVYLLMDTIPKMYNEKIEWVRHFFPFINESHVVAIKHKHLFKCDLMIEDNIQNLISGLHYERVCLSYPWNHKVRDEVYDIHRCNNWDEIVGVINKIKEE